MKILASQRLVATAANARAIEKEIKRRFNKDVRLHRGNGYYYFADPDDDTETYVSNWPESSVYVHRLNHLGDTDAWVREFERLMKEYEKWK